MSHSRDSTLPCLRGCRCSIGGVLTARVRRACHSLSTQEVNEVRAAFETFMDAVYAAVRQSGRFAWQMFWNGDSSVYAPPHTPPTSHSPPPPRPPHSFDHTKLTSGSWHSYSQDGMEEVALTGLAPLVTKANCSAQLRHFCSQAGQERLHSVAMVTSWTSRADSQQDVANFLLCAPPLAADHLTDRWPWPI